MRHAKWSARRPSCMTHSSIKAYYMCRVTSIVPAHVVNQTFSAEDLHRSARAERHEWGRSADAASAVISAKMRSTRSCSSMSSSNSAVRSRKAPRRTTLETLRDRASQRSRQSGSQRVGKSCCNSPDQTSRLARNGRDHCWRLRPDRSALPLREGRREVVNSHIRRL